MNDPHPLSKTSGRTYVIGDVQGCLDALTALLSKLQFKPQQDRLWLAGDVVNRGPYSLETLRFARENQAKMVLGNHDLHLLARAYGGKAGKRDTLDAVLSAHDAADLLDWLRHQPLIYAEYGWVMVHAGIYPDWDLATALQASREVETRLQKDPKNFLNTLYGNEPKHWQQASSAQERQRFTVNACTRMRYLDPDGGLDFKQKGSPDLAGRWQPWFGAQNRRFREPIVFGHWSTLGRVQWPEAKVWGLDTGAVWGGALTALCLEDGTITSLPTPQYQSPDQD
jgi:bis(5'-nucleosyl)-tetraphosphatase (symmetrical)